MFYTVCTCLPFVSVPLDFAGIYYPYFDIIARFRQAQLFICPLLSQSTQRLFGLFQVLCLNMHLNSLYKVFNKRSVFLSAVSCLTYFPFGGPQIHKMEPVFQTMGFAIVYIFFFISSPVASFSLPVCKC